MAITFDFSQIGSGATVNTATLRLYKHKNYNSYSKSSTYTVHTLTTDWTEGSAKWKTPWTTDGGDFNQTALDSYAYNGSYNGWIEFDITDAVQEMVAGTADNYGFIVADLNGDDGSSSSLDQESYMYSKEASSNQPELVVDYDVTEIITSLPGIKKVNISNFKVTGNKVMFDVPSAQTVSLSLYSVTGRLVMQKADLKLKTGQNTVTLFAPLSQGMYLFKFHNEKGTDIYKYLSMTP